MWTVEDELSPAARGKGQSSAECSQTQRGDAASNPPRSWLSSKKSSVSLFATITGIHPNGSLGLDSWCDWQHENLVVSLLGRIGERLFSLTFVVFLPALPPLLFTKTKCMRAGLRALISRFAMGPAGAVLDNSGSTKKGVKRGGNQTCFASKEPLQPFHLALKLGTVALSSVLAGLPLRALRRRLQKVSSVASLGCARIAPRDMLFEGQELVCAFLDRSLNWLWKMPRKHQRLATWQAFPYTWRASLDRRKATAPTIAASRRWSV